MNSKTSYTPAGLLTLVAAAVFALLSDPAAVAAAPDGAGSPEKESFFSMLDKVDAAQLELQNGNAGPFKALWSHSEDTTLAGGFGGTVEKGWARIEPRLDWVAKQFSKGTHGQERIAAAVSGELGYVVQLEHIHFVVPGSEQAATRDYRVTMIFRHEPAGWRMVHRQADSNFSKQAPK